MTTYMITQQKLVGLILVARTNTTKVHMADLKIVLKYLQGNGTKCCLPLFMGCILFYLVRKQARL